MPLCPSAPRDFSVALVLVLALSAALTPVTSDRAMAQSSSPTMTSAPAKPGTVSKVRTKSKETWTAMKARWAKQRERWADCRKRTKAEKKLDAKQKRAFLEDCMTRQ